MTTALIGLLGVVLGAVVSQGITYLVQKASDERRFRNEHEARLREERRETYTAFMAVCDRLLQDRSDEAMAKFRLKVAEGWLVSSSEAVRDSVQKLTEVLLNFYPMPEQKEVSFLQLMEMEVEMEAGHYLGSS